MSNFQTMWAFEMLKFDHFWLIAIALLRVCGGDNCFQQYNFLARSCTFPALYYGPEEIETRHFHEFSF